MCDGPAGGGCTLSDKIQNTKSWNQNTDIWLVFLHNQDTLKLVIFHSCSDCSGIMYSKTSTLLLDGTNQSTNWGSKNSIISWKHRHALLCTSIKYGPFQICLAILRRSTNVWEKDSEKLQSMKSQLHTLKLKLETDFNSNQTIENNCAKDLLFYKKSRNATQCWRYITWQDGSSKIIHLWEESLWFFCRWVCLVSNTFPKNHSHNAQNLS